MINLKCPNPACGKLSAVKDEFAGKQAKCPSCGTIMTIPSAGSATPVSARAVPPAPPPRQAAPPAVEEYEPYANEPPPPVAKSGQVTAIAIVNFVLGGLSILGGLCISLGGLLFGGLASSGPHIATKGMTPEQADKFAKEFAKAQAAVGGGSVFTWIATILVILGVISLIWGGVAIADGVGLLKRRNWSRILALVLGGVAGVVGLAYFAMGFAGGGGSPFVSGILNIAYAVWVFVVMLKPEVAREFS